MSDAATRAKERATDDPQAEVAVLAARLRDGSLTRDRLELAAYCGHAGAREALGEVMCSGCDGNGLEFGMCSDPECCDQDHVRECSECVGSGTSPRPGPPADLGDWLRGLERWPHGLLRAVVAAGKATLPCSCCGGGHPSCQRDCLGEVEALSAISLALDGDMSGVAILPLPENGGSGLRYHLRRLGVACKVPSLRLRHSPQTARWCCEESARLAGEQPVREAICAALIEWALR